MIMRKKLGIGLVLLLSSQAYSAPSGFQKVFSDGGVTLYKKNYKNGKPDYVQEINLSTGAKIKLLTGTIKKQNYNYGNYGGKNPSIQKENIKDVWRKVSNNDKNAACIVNGQFFATNANPTTLAFPVKINGNTFDGYGIGEYRGKKLILDIKNTKAEISTFADDVSVLSNNAIVGLTKNANKGYNRNTGRTFIGVADKNRDGYNETVYIFSSASTSQKEAAKVLANFGASKVMMLDGGGSSQLLCNGNSYVSSTRLLPQTIATIKAPVSYENKVNVVFDYFEKRYSGVFPRGSKTRSSGSIYYRVYYVNNKKRVLYAYKKYLYYNTGKGYKRLHKIEDWYNYIKK